MSLREYLDNAGGQLSVNSAVHVLIDTVDERWRTYRATLFIETSSPKMS